MTLEEKLEKFKGGTTVLHVPTQEVYDKLMVELEKLGYVWASGHKPTELNCWGIVIDMCIISGLDGLRHGVMEYCSSRGYNILELTLADFEPTAEELEKDIATLESLHKKYNTVITGNLENTMKEKLKRLQRVPMEITYDDFKLTLSDVEVTKDDSGYHVISKGSILALHL